MAHLLVTLTLERGVITSDLPYLHEVLEGHSDVGRLFAPNDGSAL